MRKLKREDFKKIYEVACGDWKPKLLDWYGTKFAVEEEIEVKDSEYKTMRSACTKEQHKVFDSIFGEEAGLPKTVEEAIKLLGEKDEEVKLLRRMGGLPAHIIAEQELVVITKALNDGWVADFNDHDQIKYVLWWYLGGEFRLDSWYCCLSSSVVPARLCYKSSELASHASKHFEKQWKEYLNR